MSGSMKTALRIVVFDYIAGDCTYTAKIVAKYFADNDIPAEVRAFSENDPCVVRRSLGISERWLKKSQSFWLAKLVTWRWRTLQQQPGMLQEKMSSSNLKHIKHKKIIVEE